MEAMYEKPRVNVKVERGSNFMFTRDLPHITRQWKSTFRLSPNLMQMNKNNRFS